MTDRDMVIEALSKRPIAVRPDFTKLFGPQAGIFLSQLFYWSDKGSDDQGWIYKTGVEWYEETGLKRRGQETARKELKKAGVLIEALKGNPARLHYRIDFDVLLEGLRSLYTLDKQACTERTNKNVQGVQTSLHRSAKLSLSENTTESTTEKVNRLAELRPPRNAEVPF